MEADRAEKVTEIMPTAAVCWFVEPGYTIASVSAKISSIVLGQRRQLGWFLGFGLSVLLLRRN
ncbi:MAG: hypothetical protein DMG32_12270 [Acidobacteria bacterium]|nr:MAG: hypothetical protein DMG32_12270 [Acidobacteriota bacterium]